MEQKQKEQQEGLNQALVTHANMRLTVAKEKISHAPAALAAVVCFVLYLLLFHDFEQYNMTVEQVKTAYGNNIESFRDTLRQKKLQDFLLANNE